MSVHAALGVAVQQEPSTIVVFIPNEKTSFGQAGLPSDVGAWSRLERCLWCHVLCKSSPDVPLWDIYVAIRTHPETSSDRDRKSIHRHNARALSELHQNWKKGYARIIAEAQAVGANTCSYSARLGHLPEAVGPLHPTI
jgi:hypothetical protein